MGNRHSVTSKACLSGVRRDIRSDLRDAHADASLSFDCLVAVTEACSNALLHGRVNDDTLPPSVGWEIDETRAVFWIRDFSTEQWSRSMHPSRDSVDLLNGEIEKRVGGFGLQLMRELMDDVSIERGPGGATVTLTKMLTPTAAVKS
jgi:anti-sigma regulatory factor (Ser/Thr protein kinase)